MKNYKKLLAWKESDLLARQIYIKTKTFPKDELYGITSQLRRAALSVPTNIVEGMGRQGKGETRRFVNIALGSLAETEYLLEFCLGQEYLTATIYEQLDQQRHKAGSLLWGLYNKL